MKITFKDMMPIFENSQVLTNITFKDVVGKEIGVVKSWYAKDWWRGDLEWRDPKLLGRYCLIKFDYMSNFVCELDSTIVFQPDHNLDEADIKQLKEDFPDHLIDCVDGKLWAYTRDKPDEAVEISQCSECGHYFNLEEMMFDGLIDGWCEWCCVQ